MKKLMVLLVSTVGSYIGWWLGSPGGLFGSFILSIVGLGVGTYYGAKLAKRYEP